MRRRRNTFLLACGVLLLAADPAAAVITRLTPLKEVLSSEQFIFVAAVERLDPKRPAMVLRVAEVLKGEPPFERLPVNLTGDSEAEKGKHTEALLARLREKLPVVAFVSKRGPRYTLFGFSNGTWFQCAGRPEEGGKVVRWSFLHAEPYLRRTFKGTTEELRQVVIDGLAGRKEPPEPNPKEEPGFGPEVGEAPASGACERPGTPSPRYCDRSPGTRRTTVLASGACERPGTPSPRGPVAVPGTRRTGVGVLASGACERPGTPSLRRPVAVAGTRHTGAFTRPARLIQNRYVESPGTGRSRGDSQHPGVHTPPSPGLLLGVIPSFVVVGPLAFLAALFPAVFGGLALMLRRWMAALSVLCTFSTLYLLRGWFQGRLAGTWWGTAHGLWITGAVLSGLGAVWAARRYRRAAESGREDAYRLRGFDKVVLVVLSLAGLVAVAFALKSGTSLAAFPWPEIVTFTAAFCAATLYFLASRTKRQLSAESVYLWGFTLAAAAMGAYLAGRSADPLAGVTQAGSPGAAGAHGSSAPQLRGVLWTFEPPDKGILFATPEVDGERVLAAVAHGDGFAEWGCVYAVDALTGKEVWRFDNGGDLRPIFCTPTVADGRVFIGEGFHKDQQCRLFAVNAETGAKLWEFAAASHTESRPAVAEGKVVFGAGDDGVYCLDAATGKELWHYTGAGGLHVDANPLIHAGRVYAGSGLSRAHQVTRLFCLDLQTGEEVWAQRVEYSAFGAPAVEGDFVFFGIGNGNFTEDREPVAGALLCLGRETGREVWRCPLPNSVLTRPAVDAATVYVGCRDGHCYAIDRATGTVRWKYPLNSPALASPALGTCPRCGHAEVVYAAGQRGRVAALNPATGEWFWTFDLLLQSQAPNVELVSSPVVVADRAEGRDRRRIYLGAGVTSGFASVARLYCLLEECGAKTE